ncbi:META domain-containing protein [Croceicoccus bisphenolivorans]|uniref:META domain-containing protein n=1 Tax=Croceicoccus bisphenolivorans TaxID=1783232 RepID=UPI000834490F|nr:META domain-containing protein [Croceicoccus bisphenolivorans]
MVERGNSLKWLLSCGLLALSACGSTPVVETEDEPIVPASPDPVAPSPVASGADNKLAAGFAPIAFDLAGSSWLVIAIDGEPLAERYSDLATVHFTDSMLYWQACNHHEGLYVKTRASFAAGPAMATLVACPQGSPDGAMAQVLGNRPLISRNAEGKIMLTSDKGSLTLSQMESAYRDTPAPPLEAGPFRLMIADGGARPPVLSFKGGDFAVWMDCPDAIRGQANVRKGRMATSDVAVQTTCDSHRQTAMRTLGDFLARGPSIARGANGELMLSDGETVIFGRQCHPDPSPCEYVETGDQDRA